MGKKTQKKIEKILKHERVVRSFHPAVRLLQKADGELSMFIAAAAHYGIMFSHTGGQGDYFSANARRDPRDARRLGIFARLHREGEQDDVSIGLVCEYFRTDQPNALLLELQIERVVSSPEWLVTVTQPGRAKLDAWLKRNLRRLGIDLVDYKPLSQERMFDVLFKILKDYKREVLIPRAMREKAKE